MTKEERVQILKEALFKGKSVLNEDLADNIRWLIDEVQKPSGVWILHVEDTHNSQSYFYSFESEKEAWEFAVDDAEDVLSTKISKEVFEQSIQDNLLSLPDFQYSVNYSAVL